jgi:hypothetical protein
MQCDNDLKKKKKNNGEQHPNQKIKRTNNFWLKFVYIIIEANIIASIPTTIFL